MRAQEFLLEYDLKVDLSQFKSIQDVENYARAEPDWHKQMARFGGWEDLNQIPDIKHQSVHRMFRGPKEKWYYYFSDVPGIWIRGTPAGSYDRMLLYYDYTTLKLKPRNSEYSYYQSAFPTAIKTIEQFMKADKANIEKDSWKYDTPHYIRFGRWYDNEQSKNYGTGEMENGVSVYYTSWDIEEKRWDIETSVDEASISGTMSSLILDPKKKIYLVTGNYIGDGSDDEPLLKNVRIVKELTKHDVFVGGIFDPGEFED